MNTPQKESNSSPQKRSVQGESPSKAPFPWLGPSDEIPDLGFAAFLRLMHDHFPQLVYSRESHYYARFHRSNDNPANPDFQSYPIFAREQGTMVGHEQIEGLLEEFGILEQQFRDAVNVFYELTPPTQTEGQT